MLVVDDLYRADAATLLMLRYVLRRAPVLAVLPRRATTEGPWTSTAA